MLMIAWYFSVGWGPGEAVFNARSAWVRAAACQFLPGLRGSPLSSPEDPQPGLVTFLLLLCYNPAFSLQLHSILLSSWHFSPFELPSLSSNGVLAIFEPS